MTDYSLISSAISSYITQYISIITPQYSVKPLALSETIYYITYKHGE